MTTDEWMTVDEVAGELRLSKMTIYRMLHVGELPGGNRFGRTFRVHGPTFRAWLANTTAQAS
jgi:excisionase family DNA binding protein